MRYENLIDGQGIGSERWAPNSNPSDIADVLSAGVCTQSLAQATRFRRGLQAGMVMVNTPTAGVDYHVPFGGTKGSSSGPHEQGWAAREFFTTSKTSYIRA